ncbi:hypothetical protein COO60DRAFT_1528766 [Scenedesmus sp. NREL 46B-D3]|nr:hypothetical protein COO60DRAFT_1528766 [Scenedesmus sp. NREL 46B-D3]
MRLVARSFIETGIALEQALTMIQPADRDLLGAAFAAEAAGAPLPSSKPGVAAAALGDAAAAASEAHGSMLGGFGLGHATMAVPSSSTAGKGLPVDGGLSGLSSLSFAEDVSYANHNSINMGSWGFSLFAGSATSDLNGVAASLSSLGPAEALLADVAAAPAAAQQPAGATGKDSALVGMLV